MDEIEIKEVYDAHVHFPVKNENPYAGLKNELRRNGISHFLLILNTAEEWEIFIKNADRFEKDGLFADVALLLDFRHKDGYKRFDMLKSLRKGYVVKIHPRISKITARDFRDILSCLKELMFQTVIVDNWIFGPAVENHIGTELSIYLSSQMPDKNIVMAHSGGFRVLETMMLTRPVENLYYDISLTNQYFNGSSVELDFVHFMKYEKKKIVFGSDYPDFDIESAFHLAIEHGKKAGLDASDMRCIFGTLARKLYSVNSEKSE